MNFQIVSIFGRGIWLASELHKLGINVSLFEIEDIPIVSEDIENPFGIFKNLNRSFLNKLENESQLINVKNGFTIWLNDSCIEFRNKLDSFKNISRDTIDHLKGNAPLVKDNFDKNWLSYLSCIFASNKFINNISIKNKKPMPLFDPIFYRKTSRRDIVDFKYQLKQSGINTFENFNELNFSNKNLNHTVWMLTSYETNLLFPKIFKDIFNNLYEPTWFWVRFQIFIEAEVSNVLPDYFLNIEDIKLHWCYENFIIFQKSFNKNIFNCWIKLPAKLDNENLIKYSNKLKNILFKKINKNISVTYYPKNIGLSAFPVYDKELNFETDLILDSP